MSNNLAKIDYEDPTLITVLGSSIFPGAKAESIAMVLDYCKARGLDPFLKPVHIVPFKDNKTGQYRDVIIPGLNLYRVQAVQTGALLGISEPAFGPLQKFHFKSADGKNTIDLMAPEYAKVTVKRRLPTGEVGEFTAIEFFAESVGLSNSRLPTAMWQKRPRGMLAKTAESQALRRGFPDIVADSVEDEYDYDPNVPEVNAQAVELPNVEDAKVVDTATGEVKALPDLSKITEHIERIMSIGELTAYWRTLDVTLQQAVQPAFSARRQALEAKQ